VALTLSLLASVLVLLPGLAALLAFNLRTRRGGARRPELSLTTISALVIAAVMSMLVHVAAWMTAEGVIDLVIAVHERLPSLDFGIVSPNPLGAFFDAIAESRPMTLQTALWLAATLVAETLAVGHFIMSDFFELTFESLDFNGQGWVFQHITRPAENGYTPFGHVFTSTMSGRYGIAYKGPIIDIRQGDKGEVLSIALARPERFLYELGSFPATNKVGWFSRIVARPAADAAVESGVQHHEKDYVGGVVALDARVINNIVVHSVADSLLDEIDETIPDVPLEVAP
jgi:hypothetical protein